MDSNDTKTLEAILRISKDLREGVKTISQAEARFLVDLYYQIQDYRIQAGNQISAIKRGVDESSSTTVAWLQENMRRLEENCKKLLDSYSDVRAVGRWSKSVCGIGPVLAAGLLAHIDIEQAPTVGHIWRLAGLDPTQSWLGTEKAAKLVKSLVAEETALEDMIPLVAQRMGSRPETVTHWATTGKDGKARQLSADSLAKAAARRPWNARLKVLCWKIGESFVKVSNNPKDVYGHLWRERKEQEEAKNGAGLFVVQAAAALQAKKIGKETEAYKAYSQGRLPPAHLHARAKRYAVKLFLAHWHEVAYEERYGKKPPLPYPIAILGHAHVIEVPRSEERPG